MAIRVNVDNFVRAESDRMSAAVAARAPINEFDHRREPAAIDDQTVIRMNRDTLYSVAIVDISQGATLTLPDAGDRYLSVMVVNNDHYINEVIYDPGEHELTVDRFDTDYVRVSVRTLVNPDDPTDLAAVHALQDQLQVKRPIGSPVHQPRLRHSQPRHNPRTALNLARGSGFAHTFGTQRRRRSGPPPIGTAAGWGGRSGKEAFYLNVDPGFPPGEYRLTVARRTRRRVRLELPPLPTTPRDPRRHLDVPHNPTPRSAEPLLVVVLVNADAHRTVLADEGCRTSGVHQVLSTVAPTVVLGCLRVCARSVGRVSSEIRRCCCLLPVDPGRRSRVRLSLVRGRP